MSDMAAPTPSPAAQATPLWRRPLTWVIAFIALVAIGLASTASLLGRWLDDPADADPVATTTVRVVDHAFEPPAAAVPVGATVTWRWTGEEEHNVVLDEGPASPLQTSGEWEHTFDAAGDYRYSCTIHPFMDGRVVVGDGATSG